MPKRPRILFVDDDPRALEGYREYFELKGFAVQTAADGAAALDVLADFPPEIMVLDMELPVIDGWEVARRSKALNAAVIVVAVTGHSAASERASAARAGCDLYVTKPCSPIMLVSQIRKLLASHLQ